MNPPLSSPAEDDNVSKGELEVVSTSRGGVTANDNQPAIDFYRRMGLRLVAIHRGAIAESRKLKPEIALRGIAGRPIEDEIEFDLPLGPA